MARRLSTTALQAILAQDTGETFIPLLSISHEDLQGQTIRVAGSRKDVMTRDGVFLAYPFQIVLPDEREDRPPEVTLIIDNVDRSIVNTLRQIQSSPQVSMMVVLEQTPDIIEAGPFNFTLYAAEWTRLEVRGTLAYEQILDEPYPAATFNPAEFQGLFK